MESPVQQKSLGNTGVMIPEIGLGVWKYRGGVEPLRRGVELGACLIDTAEIYRTEDVVGQAVKGIRDQVFLATKVSGSHLRYDDVLRAADASLHELGIATVDLYQVHWPNSSVPITETMRAMATLVDRKQVKYIGVSNFSTQELRRAQAALPNHPIVSNQVLYNLNDREIERELLPYCQQHDVTIIAYTPLDDGRLAVKSRWRRRQGMAVLEEIATQTHKTLAQVALNWCVSQPNVIVIPKSDSVARTEENCRASGWRLTPAQLALLNEAFA
ncbi:MAG: aldo/keto reductase [Deltaproteobacteria bacterium]|nr:aldo/keto reductase [Deltaproteobacteria bacterium]